MTAISLINTQTATPADAGSAFVPTRQSGFAILHGSLAPEGCVARLEGFGSDMVKGEARVFASADAAHDAIAAGEITMTNIIVIRDADANAANMAGIVRSLSARDLSDVTVITDGRIGSDAVSSTFRARIIGNVAPNAAAGGPIAQVRDGDTIHIDIATRQINLMSERPIQDLPAETSQNFAQKSPKPWGPLEKYARLVTSAD